MSIRHVLTGFAALCLMVPALAQDSEPAPSATQSLRATGAYPIEQARGQWLGSNLIGAKVVSAGNQTIGRISNLVVNENGEVEAAVIAVGGVFGVGKKDVAVTFRSLNITRTRAGDAIDHVTLAATKDDLQQAADFKTLAQQKR